MLAKRGIQPVIINYQDPKKVESFKKIVSEEQAAQHEAFFKEYYQLGPLLTKPEEIEPFCLNELDGVIVGSDAIFRLAAKYSPKRIAKRLLRRDQTYTSFSSMEQLSPYWLNWEKPTKNTSFGKASIAASSRGTPFYFLKPSLMGDVKRAVADFDLVTVRDSWTKKLVRCLSLGQSPAEICHDPVFGLNANFELPQDEQNLDLSRTILVSLKADPSWRKAFVEEAHRRDYEVKLLPSPEDYFPFPECDGEISLPFSPLEWYRCLSKAAGYVGFRFHALVSCMCNETPVVTVDTGQNLFKGPDRRSPCYFTCQEAKILPRYFTKKKLKASSPTDVIQLLFDENLQRKANAFSKASSDQVNCIVDRTIELFKSKSDSLKN